MKSLRDYKGSNKDTTLKEKDKFRKRALELLKQYKAKQGKASSADVDALCNKLNDKVIVEIMLDKDKKYISTNRARTTIDKVIEKAQKLK